jgi:hypothetical protein
MRRMILAASLLAVGAACGWLARSDRTPRPGLAPERVDANLRAVRIDRPDPTSPSGRKSTLLSVYRVTGGPEGTIEYAPVPTRTSPSGVEDIHPGPEMWVLSVGQRSYVFGPRD